MIRNLKIIEEATSSSDLAKDEILNNRNKFDAFFVYEQTKGRGTLNKEWISHKGNLHLSIIVKPKKPLLEWKFISIISAVAIRRSLIKIYGHLDTLLKFKWPNDFIINNKKIGGILLETIPRSNSLVIGMGLNLVFNPNNIKNGWPSENIKNINGINIDPIKLSYLIIDNLNLLIEDWENNNFFNVFSEWKSNLCFLGEQIHSFGFNKKYCGIFEDVGSKGQMFLKTKNNKIIEFSSGTFVPKFMIDKYVTCN